MTNPHPIRTPREPHLWEALVPVVLLILFISASVLWLEVTAHVPLIFGIAVAALMAHRLGFTWQQTESGLLHGITLGLQACLVLLVIGCLIGTWIASGIVPAMVYYGLELVSPGAFLVTTCVVCAVVSLATGSSWSTAGTVGLAFIGIGQALQVPAPMVAGAIISGSYFGDKMSPLSDTTNLAPATAGTDLFTHVQHMALTTGPSLLIALVLYTILGLTVGGGIAADSTMITQMQGILAGQFHLTPWLLVAPLFVIATVVLRVPALPALLAGAILGGLIAVTLQGQGLAAAVKTSYDGFRSATGSPVVDELLSRGGMVSMLPTIALIFCALGFGGVLERTGMLAVIARAALKLAVNTGMLVTTTIVTCIGLNVIAGDQYISIVVPGRMYRDAFAARGLHMKNLSRCLEDAGTLTSPLVPWNTCGAFMAATLGVSPLVYLPFAFLNLVNPLVSILYGFTGWTMHPSEPNGDEASSADMAVA